MLLVFFAHLGNTEQNHYRFAGLGILGVVIFFVHTSIVLMASLHRLEKSAGSLRSLALAFWIRRFFRIYPLSILCVIVVTAFRIPVSDCVGCGWIGIKGFLANLALVQNLTGSVNVEGALWTLPIEIQMYLILPFAYLAVHGERRFRSLALWPLSLLLALASLATFSIGNLFFYAPCFTSGIVAYDLIRSRVSARKLPAWIWPVGVAAMIALFGPYDGVVSGGRFLRAWGLSLLLGILYANVKEIQISWINEVFHWIAERSYGIYLSHPIAMWIALNRMAQFPLWVRITSLIVLAIVIPALLYPSIEKPLISAGGHLAKRLLKHSNTNKNIQLA